MNETTTTGLSVGTYTLTRENTPLTLDKPTFTRLSLLLDGTASEGTFLGTKSVAGLTPVAIDLQTGVPINIDSNTGIVSVTIEITSGSASLILA